MDGRGRMLWVVLIVLLLLGISGWVWQPLAQLQEQDVPLPLPWPALPWLALLDGGLAVGVVGWWLGRRSAHCGPAQLDPAQVQQIRVAERAALLHELHMLEHGPLKTAVVAIQLLLAQAQELVAPEQEALGLRLARVQAQTADLLDLVMALYARDADDLGVLPGMLHPTMQRLCQQLEAQGVTCTVTEAGQPRSAVPRAVEQVLELVLVNAVMNAREHGQAHTIRISLHWHLAAVALTIADDGRGFDPAAVPVRPGRGYGLKHMAAVVARCQGQLTVASQPRVGTTVRVQLPLPEPRLGWATAPHGQAVDDTQAGRPKGVRNAASPVALAAPPASSGIRAAGAGARRPAADPPVGALSARPPWVSGP